MGLTQKAFKSGFWVSALRVAIKGFGFIRLVVLARLLTPKDFGIMAVVMVSIDFLYQFSNFAVGKALIQKSGDIEDYLGTVWIQSICRGILIYCILYFTAPFMASFFKNPEAEQYIRVAAFSPLVLGFLNPRVIYIDRELEFRKKFILGTSSTAVDIVISICFAFILRNVWALIIGLLAGNVARVMLSYRILPPAFRINFDISKAAEIYHFGKWLFLNQILTFASGRMGDVMIGRLISVTSLGYYQMALKIANLIPGELTHVLSQTLFPAYSKIKDNMARFRKVIFKVAQFNSAVGLPLAVLTCYFAPEIVFYVLGDQWMTVVPIVRILTVNMLLNYIGAGFGPLFLSLGRTDLVFKLQIFALCILLPLMYFLTSKYGPIGTAWSLVIAKICVLPVSRTIIFRILGCSFFEYLKWIKEPVLASLGMVGVLYLFQYLIPAQSVPLIKAVVLLLLAIGSYYGFLLFLLNHYKSELAIYLSWRGLRKMLLGKT